MSTKAHRNILKNSTAFVRDLTRLLKKYDAHKAGTGVVLKTANLNIAARKLDDCPKECVHIEEVCDENGKNCKLKVWCDCDS